MVTSQPHSGFAKAALILAFISFHSDRSAWEANGTRRKLSKAGSESVAYEAGSIDFIVTKADRWFIIPADRAVSTMTLTEGGKYGDCLDAWRSLGLSTIII